jgi:predicted unusual protein kinase regulating ubiquinone biosynthesis (AarF/ABC1/UbiB family)
VSELARTLRSLSEPFREPNETAFQREFEQRIGPLIDQPPGHTAPLQKLVSEAVDVLRDAGYRLDPELTLAAKAVAQAEAITSALLPEAGVSDFAQLGGAALEELVPEAVNSDAILGAARKQAIFAVGEMAERLPSLETAAARWVDQLAWGEIPVGIRFSDLDRYSMRFESVTRLIAATILLTGLLIGSAIAATTGAGKSVFRTDVSDAALVVYVAAAVGAVVLVVVPLWRLFRAEGRRSPGRDKLR